MEEQRKEFEELTAKWGWSDPNGGAVFNELPWQEQQDHSAGHPLNPFDSRDSRDSQGFNASACGAAVAAAATAADPSQLEDSQVKWGWEDPTAPGAGFHESWQGEAQSIPDSFNGSGGHFALTTDLKEPYYTHGEADTEDRIAMDLSAKWASNEELNGQVAQDPHHPDVVGDLDGARMDYEKAATKWGRDLELDAADGNPRSDFHLSSDGSTWDQTSNANPQGVDWNQYDEELSGQQSLMFLANSETAEAPGQQLISPVVADFAAADGFSDGKKSADPAHDEADFTCSPAVFQPQEFVDPPPVQPVTPKKQSTTDPDFHWNLHAPEFEFRPREIPLQPVEVVPSPSPEVAVSVDPLVVEGERKLSATELLVRSSNDAELAVLLAAANEDPDEMEDHADQMISPRSDLLEDQQHGLANDSKGDGTVDADDSEDDWTFNDYRKSEQAKEESVNGNETADTSLVAETDGDSKVGEVCLSASCEANDLGDQLERLTVEDHPTVEMNSIPTSAKEEAKEELMAQPDVEKQETVDTFSTVDSKDSVQIQPVAEYQSIVESQPILENQPFGIQLESQSDADTQPKVVESQPITESTVESQPITEILPAVETNLIAEIQPTVEAQPVSEAEPAVEAQPVAEVQPEVNIESLEESHQDVENNVAELNTPSQNVSEETAEVKELEVSKPVPTEVAPEVNGVRETSPISDSGATVGSEVASVAAGIAVAAAVAGTVAAKTPAKKPTTGVKKATTPVKPTASKEPLKKAETARRPPAELKVSDTKPARPTKLSPLRKAAPATTTPTKPSAPRAATTTTKTTTTVVKKTTTTSATARPAPTTTARKVPAASSGSDPAAKTASKPTSTASTTRTTLSARTTTASRTATSATTSTTTSTTTTPRRTASAKPLTSATSRPAHPISKPALNGDAKLKSAPLNRVPAATKPLSNGTSSKTSAAPKPEAKKPLPSTTRPPIKKTLVKSPSPVKSTGSTSPKKPLTTTTTPSRTAKTAAAASPKTEEK